MYSVQFSIYMVKVVLVISKAPTTFDMSPGAW
jgi:hypothetical protein